MSEREKWLNLFVSQVEEMRAEQKKYFKTRQPVHLQNSKALESAVDANIKSYRLKGAPAAPVTQEKLF